MALKLLDGTTAAIDITSKILVADASETSMKCIASQVSFTFRRPTTPKTTFCGTGWASGTPGNKQMFAVVGGFMSTGADYSDPLAFFTEQTGVAFTLTADTGSTVTGTWIETEDASTLIAAANSGRSMAFESQGVVSTTWIVA